MSRRRLWVAGARNQRGLVTTELAVLFPVLILVVLGMVQLALSAHANAVAQAAAEHGAEAAASFGGSADDGEVAAQDFLVLAGQIDDPQIEVFRDTASAAVIVRGSYPSVFGRLEVAASASVPVERVVP